MIPAAEDMVTDFLPVSLSEMQGAELQNRLDFKFVFQRSRLTQVLEGMREHYRVLEINGVRLQHYDTLYYDTKDHQLYLAHHNQRGNRMKIRIRYYASNALCFAEMKSKLNTGRVIKKRYPVAGLESQLPPEVLNGTYNRDGIRHEDLLPGVMIRFDRITFMALSGAERVTLDINLTVSDEEQTQSIGDLVIAELKLYRKEHSVFNVLMQQLRIRPWSVSKYCLAISLLKQEVRKNNFKPVHIYLNKLQNNSRLNGTRPV